VALNGRITIDSAPELRTLLFERLQSPGSQCLIVDFGDVDYIDTSGLAILMETLKAARIANKSLQLARLQEQPRYLLEATRLLNLFDQVTEP
jgi:anti-sigma B factor antagonist